MNETTPILSLPNELLVAIAAAGQEGRVPDSRSTVFKSEWTLSHVCRRFRECIVGAPSLWTLVEANLEAEGSLQILEIYLERCQACNIWASFLNHSPTNYISGAERLNRIIPFIDRMWRLEIVLQTPRPEKLLAAFRDLTATNLQHLEIINEVNKPKRSPVEIFSAGMSKLTFFKMDGLQLKSPLPQWTTSLTHLELRRDQGRVDHAIAITTQCPVLVLLHLDLRWMGSMDTPQDRFHIPSLKILRISVSDEDAFFLLVIFNLFDTPALTEFMIDGSHGDQIFVLFNLTSLPHSSFPALTSLSFIKLDSCSCEVDVTVDFSNSLTSPPLQLFPALASLTLINQCFAHNLVKDLLGPASPPWPRLKSVTLCPKENTLDDVHSAFREAVQSKFHGGKALPKIRLSPRLECLEEWQEEGADVEIFDPDTVLDDFRAP
ncbi:hypothetical protein B0H19DRAFT_1367122 [Mycena capillaripes]|nr:hypothetical protein B0H19DRAFT_1367122 [Mycena capillaripes]